QLRGDTSLQRRCARWDHIDMAYDQRGATPGTVPAAGHVFKTTTGALHGEPVFINIADEYPDAPGCPSRIHNIPRSTAETLRDRSAALRLRRRPGNERL